MAKHDQVQLAKMRVAHALRDLNAALTDAHRVGLRTRVFPLGHSERQRARVVLMNPVDIKLVHKKEGE